MKPQLKLPKNNGRKPARRLPRYTSDAFVSHTEADKTEAAKLALELRAASYRVWFDATSIRPGHSIPGQVQAGLRHSRHIIVLMSPASMRSPWVEKEYLSQLMKNPANTDCRIIPVRLKRCTIPDFLLDLKYIDAVRGITHDILAQIMLALGDPMQLRPKKTASRRRSASSV